MAGAAQTVLLIEDEPLIRMGTAAMLEDSGFMVLEAANADEANILISSHPEISAVITDVQMPGSMNGLEFASLVHRERPEVPILITSGRTGIQEARKHGATRFLSKPYTAQGIQDALTLMKR